MGPDRPSLNAGESRLFPAVAGRHAAASGAYQVPPRPTQGGQALIDAEFSLLARIYRDCAARRDVPLPARHGTSRVKIRGSYGLMGLALALALGCGGHAAAADGCDRVVVSGDADYQPLSWYDGDKMRGAAEAIVGAALDRIGVPYEIRYVGPFKRMLAAAEAGEIDVVAELKKTEERERFLLFSSTPVFVNPVAVFTHRSRNLKLPRPQDLVGLRGGMVIANQFGGELDRLVREELTIEEVPRLDLGLGMVEADHLDYFITSYYPRHDLSAGSRLGADLHDPAPLSGRDRQFHRHLEAERLLRPAGTARRGPREDGEIGRVEAAVRRGDRSVAASGAAGGVRGLS